MKLTHLFEEKDQSQEILDLMRKLIKTQTVTIEGRFGFDKHNPAMKPGEVYPAEDGKFLVYNIFARKLIGTGYDLHKMYDSDDPDDEHKKAISDKIKSRTEIDPIGKYLHNIVKDLRGQLGFAGVGNVEYGFDNARNQITVEVKSIIPPEKTNPANCDKLTGLYWALIFERT